MVSGEGDTSRSYGHVDDEGHARDGALHSTWKLHDIEACVGVFPEEHVVLEVDPIVLAQAYLGDGHYLALNLATAGPKAYLGHVLDARGLSPARFADEVTDV